MSWFDAAATVTVGVAAGWLLAAANPPPPEAVSGSAVVESAEHLSPADAPPREITAEEAECPNTVTASSAEAQISIDPLPKAYLDIVGPIETSSPRPDAFDRYAAFARDPRDEVWASTMESGVNVWASKLDTREMIIDYVECRSRYCLVAGYALGNSTSQVGELWTEGWWQADGTVSEYMVSGRDRTDHFVLFVDRYANDGTKD